jgi:hypothetical protein
MVRIIILQKAQVPFIGTSSQGVDGCMFEQQDAIIIIITITTTFQDMLCRQSST